MFGKKHLEKKLISVDVRRVPKSNDRIPSKREAQGDLIQRYTREKTLIQRYTRDEGRDWICTAKSRNS